MNNSTLKATQTREQTQATKSELYRERLESVKLLQYALHRVLDSEEATSKEILRAAELLAELVRPHHY